MSKFTAFLRAWWPIILIIAGAAAVRLIGLDAKPLHHDESIHAYYSWQLLKEGRYEYHPLSHGPFLYYLMAALFKLFGVSDAVARLGPAVFGALLVGGIWSMRSYLQKPTVWILMIIAATSPLLVYVSRFARHDMINLFCTLVMIIATIEYLRRRREEAIYAGILAFFVSYSAHELTYITGVIWLIATIWTILILPDRSTLLQGIKAQIWHFLLATVVGLFIATLFYSSFGKFAEGLMRALPDPSNPDSALGYWIAQHDVRRGSQPIYFYFLLLPLYEIVPFLLGLGSALFGVWQNKNIAWRLISTWALLTLAAYSVAGERMPWLTVHSLLPLILASGFGLEWLWGRFGPNGRIALAAILVTLLSFTAFNTYRLAFINPANPVELAVYVQTQPIVKDLTKEFAAQGDKLSLAVGTDLTWPMAWYYRDLPYQLTEISTTAPGTSNALVSLDEAAKGSIEAAYQTSTKYPFRSWWVPTAGWPGLIPLWHYYIDREPWNELGSYDFLYLQGRK